MKLILIFFIFVFITNSSTAKDLSYKNKLDVLVEYGNIYYLNSEGKKAQLTYSGHDSSPMLSPNNKIVAFIRVGNQVIPKQCDADTGSKFGNQIWIYDFSTKKERLLVKNNFACDEPEKKIIDPTDLCFSPDNKSLYFITPAWTTSGALHKVDIETGMQRYIAPANEFKVVSKGENRGSLIVYQHRYFIGGGSYDWYWLLNTKGKEEGPIGPEITKEQMDFIES